MICKQQLFKFSFLTMTYTSMCIYIYFLSTSSLIIQNSTKCKQTYETYEQTIQSTNMKFESAAE